MTLMPSAADSASAACAPGKGQLGVDTLKNRILILAALSLITAMLAGCSIITPTVPWNETEERARLIDALNSWVRGVEDYDVDAMAGDGILAAGFKLIIEEGISYIKNADTLRSELNSDAALQAEWRHPPTNYRLRLDIDSGVVEGDVLSGKDDVNGWTIVSASRTSAKVTSKFEVYEWMANMDPWMSDNGIIEVDLIRTPNAWRMMAMKIKFGVAFYDTDVTAEVAKAGFGFGRGPM